MPRSNWPTESRLQTLCFCMCAYFLLGFFFVFLDFCFDFHVLFSFFFFLFEKEGKNMRAEVRSVGKSG